MSKRDYTKISFRPSGRADGKSYERYLDMANQVSTCNGCGARILWGRGRALTRMPYDYENRHITKEDIGKFVLLQNSDKIRFISGAKFVGRIGWFTHRCPTPNRRNSDPVFLVKNKKGEWVKNEAKIKKFLERAK